MMAERARQATVALWHPDHQAYIYGIEAEGEMTLLEEREWVAWFTRNMAWAEAKGITLGPVLDG